VWAAVFYATIFGNTVMNHPLFTKTFFRFFMGFIAILGTSFAVIFIVASWAN